MSSVFVAVFMLSLISCNEKLSVVGNTFPPDTLQLTSVITTDSQPLVATSVPFAQSSSLSGFGVVYIGKTPTVEAITLSRLVIPDTLPTIPAENIMSATLEITPTRPLYAFGDTASNQLSFSVVKVKKLWSPRATLDSITPTADYFDNSALATFTGKIDLKDSTGSIKINFDKSQIAEWISLRNQYKNDTLNYGIAFIPSSGSSVIRRFSSGAVGSTSTKQFATVTVTYKKSLTDAKEDTVSLISGYDGTFFSTPSPEILTNPLPSKEQ